jgi:hypothetical protein
VLHLIKMWLESPVEETDDRGRKTRTTAARDNRRGGPRRFKAIRCSSALACGTPLDRNSRHTSCPILPDLISSNLPGNFRLAMAGR